MQLKEKLSEESPAPSNTAPILEFYQEPDVTHRWQGDIFKATDFAPGTTNSSTVPYWILVDRTCKLVEGDGRSINLKYLNFSAAYPIDVFLENEQKTKYESQIKVLIKEDNDSVQFLPDCPNKGIDLPLLMNFNMIISVPVESAPTASQKVLQMSSPFSEHVFQRFSRFFYTVGFNDTRIRSKEYQIQVATLIRQKRGQN